MRSVQKIATLIKANQAIILPFFCTPAAMNIFFFFFGGYIEMCSKIYILDCISCNLFWSYWQFANKNSKQDATVHSSRTVGSDFGIHEWAGERGPSWRGTLLPILLSNVIWAFVWWISWNMEEIWAKGFPWLPLFLPHLGNNKEKGESADRGG